MEEGASEVPEPTPTAAAAPAETAPEAASKVPSPAEEPAGVADAAMEVSQEAPKSADVPASAETATPIAAEPVTTTEADAPQAPQAAEPAPAAAAEPQEPAETAQAAAASSSEPLPAAAPEAPDAPEPQDLPMEDAPAAEQDAATADLGLLPNGANQCKVTIRHDAGSLAKSFLLPAGRTLRMGRHPHCDMLLEFCEGISAHHCSLLLRKVAAGYALSIRDVSRNGTGARPSIKSQVEGKAVKRPFQAVPKGTDFPLADSWELKLPLKSRAGKAQIPETQRLLTIHLAQGPYDGLPVAGANQARPQAFRQMGFPQVRTRGNMVQTFPARNVLMGDQPVPRASGVIAAQVAPEGLRPMHPPAPRTPAVPPLAATSAGSTAGLPAELEVAAAAAPPKEKKRKEKKHKGEKAGKAPLGTGFLPGEPLAVAPAAAAPATEELSDLAAALAAEKAWELKRRRKEKREREKGTSEAVPQPRPISEVAGFGRGGVPAAAATPAVAPPIAEDQASEKSDGTNINDEVQVLEGAPPTKASSIAATARPKAFPTGTRLQPAARLTEAALQERAAPAGAGIALNRRRPPPLGQVERSAPFDPRDMSVSPISTPGIGAKGKKRRKKKPDQPGAGGGGGPGSDSMESLVNAPKGKRKPKGARGQPTEGLVDAYAGARLRSPDRWSPSPARQSFGQARLLEAKPLRTKEEKERAALQAKELKKAKRSHSEKKKAAAGRERSRSAGRQRRRHQ